MILIVKNASKEAKKALEDFKNKERQNAHFKNFKISDGKSEVQESLESEQFHLCAYCMRRIHHTEKIEHFETQESSKVNANPHETLDYNNLLAVCNGISVHNSDNIEHCDSSRSKSNKVLTINPLDKSTLEKIKYLRNGKIFSDDEEIDDDLDNKKVLNLNNLQIQDNRKRIYESVKILIDIKCKGKSEELANKEIRKIVEDWKNPQFNESKSRTELKEYCGIVLYFFEKYLKN